MSEPQADEEQAKTIAPSTRVSVAFPFSRITVNEPGELLCELAHLVDRLATALADESSAAEHKRIARDAARLADRIDSQRAS